MKKIISCVLAGAVMLGLTACAGQAGTAGADTSTEAVQSEAETTEEVTTDTSEESTAETSGETTVLTSEDPTQNDDTVIAESESKVTVNEETKPSAADTETSKATKNDNTNNKAGDIIVDFTGKSAEVIAENILSAKQLKANETVESYAKRFSITPETSHVGNLWSFDWPEDKLTNFSIRTVQIRTKGEKFVIDDSCDVIITVWFDSSKLCNEVCNYIRDKKNNDKRSSNYNFFEADGIYQYTLEAPVKIVD